MIDVRVKHALSVMATATVATALLSLVGGDATAGFNQQIPCGALNSTAPCSTRDCPTGLTCDGVNGTCGCVPAGCCSFLDRLVSGAGGAAAVSGCSGNLGPAACAQFSGEFLPGASCTTLGCVTQTPTSTPTSTPTVTPRLPDGDTCDDPADCLSGNCVDDVCCDTACDDPLQSCNQPGSVGTCSPVSAPAPAASHTGMALIIVTLIAIGAVAMLRLRRADR